MKRLARPLALVVAGAALGWSGATLAQEPASARAAVAAAVERAWPGAKLGDVDEDELELAGFEAEVKAGGHELDVRLAPDGTIVEVSREATPDELPAPVKERLAALGGAVGDLTRVERRAQLQAVALPAPVITWEVTLTRKGGERAGRFDVRLGADGAVLSEERDDDAAGEGEGKGKGEDDEERDEPSRGGTRR